NPLGAVGGDAQRPGDAVRGEKAHTPDVVDELVGILLDPGDGPLPVGLVDPGRQSGADAQTLQEDEALPGLPLSFQGLVDLAGLLTADAGHLGERPGRSDGNSSRL